MDVDRVLILMKQKDVRNMLRALRPRDSYLGVVGLSSMGCVKTGDGEGGLLRGEVSAANSDINLARIQPMTCGRRNGEILKARKRLRK